MKNIIKKFKLLSIKLNFITYYYDLLNPLLSHQQNVSLPLLIYKDGNHQTENHKKSIIAMDLPSLQFFPFSREISRDQFISLNHGAKINLERLEQERTSTEPDLKCHVSDYRESENTQKIRSSQLNIINVIY